MGNVVKNKIVLSNEDQLKTLGEIGEIKMEFDNGKTMTLNEYLKMMINLSQCGIKSSLVLTIKTE